MTEKQARQIKPGDTLKVHGTKMHVMGVKSNEYGVETGVTLYLRGPDGLTDVWHFDDTETVSLDA